MKPQVNIIVASYIYNVIVIVMLFNVKQMKPTSLLDICWYVFGIYELFVVTKRDKRDKPL